MFDKVYAPWIHPTNTWKKKDTLPIANSAISADQLDREGVEIAQERVYQVSAV